MKKVFKRVLAAALIATMVISLAACGDNSKDDGKVTINVFRDTFNLANADTKEVKAVEDAINAYIADKIDVKITLTDIGSGEYKDKAQLALKNNEINLLWTASWMELVGCDDVYKDNSVYDISTLLKGSTLYNSIPESIWAASRYDGKDYFVPCYKESAEGYELMFRTDLIELYGWDISNISSLKDIEPMLEDLKNAGNIKYPYLTQKTAMFHRYYLDDFDFFTQESFVAVDRDTNEVVNSVQSAEYKEFVTLMAEWHEKGYLSEDDATKQTTDTTTQSKDWGISWWTSVPNNDEADSRYKQSVDMAQITDKYAHSTTTLGSCFCVTSNSTEAQAKACVDFLGLLYTDKALADLYTFGIEGTDYDLVNGKVVKKGDMYNHSAWESCNVLCLSLTSDEPDEKVQLYKDFNNAAVASCAAGFRYNVTPVEAEFTACQTVFEEYGFILENGGIASADIDATLAAYQTALDAAGYQKVLTEFQNQYNEWKNQ